MSQNPGEYGLPASHALHFVDLTKVWGVSERELFDGLGLRREDLVDPYLTIPLPTVIALVERARVFTGEPALGMHLGLRMSASAHGYLGFAAMSAATLGEAIALAVQYAPIRTTALDLHLEVTPPTAALVVEERADFGSARDVILLGLLVGLWQIGNTLLEREVKESTIHVQFAEPPYYARVKGLAPRIWFGQSTHQVVFDASLLDAPLASADPGSLRLARDQCDQLRDSLVSRSRYLDRARHLVLRAGAGARSFDELAAAVQLSPRTLRRRLADEGVTFTWLLDEERRHRAVQLLRSQELSTKDVADRLGYSNVANFMRAFRRWTGQTPAAYRSNGK